MLTTASTALQAVGASGLRVLGGGSRGASLLRVLQQSAAQHRAVADAGTAALALQRQHRHREWWPSTSSSSGPAPSCHALSAANSCHLHLPSRGLCTSLSPASAASGEDGDAAAPRRRRRSATESNAALRRTTVSTLACDHMAVFWQILVTFVQRHVCAAPGAPPRDSCAAAPCPAWSAPPMHPTTRLSLGGEEHALCSSHDTLLHM